MEKLRAKIKRDVEFKFYKLEGSGITKLPFCYRFEGAYIKGYAVYSFELCKCTKVVIFKNQENDIITILANVIKGVND